MTDRKLILEIDGEQATVEVSDETWHMLVAIMLRNDLSLAGAITQAVQTEDFIEKQIASGAKLLAAKGDMVRELGFAPK